MLANINDARLAHELLKHLALVPRFGTTMFFLLDSEKKIIKDLIGELQKHVTLSTQLIAAYTV